MTDETLNDFFDIGDIDGYTPPDDDAFPLLDASKTVWEPGPDGKRVRKEEPRYLFKGTTPGKSGRNFFGDQALIARALSVYPSKKDKRRVSLAIEIPKFLTKDELTAAVQNDDKVPEHLKEERIAAKKRGLDNAKGQAMTLAKALVGSTDLRALSSFLQSPDFEGAYFAASIGVRGYCRTCKSNERVCKCDEETKDIRRNNYWLRFYPASDATEPMPADN